MDTEKKNTPIDQLHTGRNSVELEKLLRIQKHDHNKLGQFLL